MSWNYRVVLVDPKETPIYYEIREVYYNEDGTIWAMTEEPATVIGGDIEELREDLDLMEDAFLKEVLIESEMVYVDKEGGL